MKGEEVDEAANRILVRIEKRRLIMAELDGPRTDLEEASAALAQAWKEFVHALRNTGPGRVFVWVADWLLTGGRR